MAIHLYYGKIGDGKTYHVLVNEVLPALRSGRKVYTNLDGLNRRLLAMHLGKGEDELNLVILEGLEAIRNIHKTVADGSLVVIDEAQYYWDARGFKDTEKGFLNWLEYHRHHGLDIVFVTQSPKRLESAISRLSNYSFQVKNLKILGSMFARRYVIHVRQTPFDREIISSMRGSLRKDIFPLYRSAIIHGKKIKVKSALSQFPVYVGVLFLIFGVGIFTASGGFSFMKAGKAKGVKKYVSSKGSVVDGAVNRNPSILEVFKTKKNFDLIPMEVESEPEPVAVPELVSAPVPIPVRVRVGSYFIYESESSDKPMGAKIIYEERESREREPLGSERAVGDLVTIWK